MRLIEVSGTFESCGEAAGESTRDDIRAVLAALEAEAGDRYAERHAVARRHFAAAERGCPEAAAWIRGLARGSGLALFNAIFTAFCEEAAETPAKGCSTLVVPSKDGTLLGHNEDYPAFNLGRMFLLRLDVPGRPRTVSLNYPGQLPGIAGSLNGHGLALTCNALPCWGDSGGVSNNVNHFKAMFAKDIGEAVRALTSGPFALGHHYTVVPASGAAVSIETAPRRYSDSGWTVLPVGGRKPFFHTNHVLRLKLKEADAPYPDSRVRLERLKRASKKPPKDADALMAMLSTDRTLCKTDAAAGSVTLASLVVCPAKRSFTAKGRGGAGAITRMI